MKRRRQKEPLTETDKKLQAVQGKHDRLLTAFLALRSLRSISHSTEPALRIVRDRMSQLPDSFVDRLHLKNPAPMKRLLRSQVERIIRDMDIALIENPDESVTATYARYLDAVNRLKPGDLESDPQP